VRERSEDAPPRAGVGGTPVNEQDDPIDPGLCRRCTHAQTVASSKGGLFWLCRLSSVDPRFPRYPTLPVLRCSGFKPALPAES
jgi:hypothetical protein